MTLGDTRIVSPPYGDTGSRLGLPEGTVKAQISRGRSKLEKLLGALD